MPNDPESLAAVLTLIYQRYAEAIVLEKVEDLERASERQKLTLWRKVLELVRARNGETTKANA
jgi:hypothetical protein